MYNTYKKSLIKGKNIRMKKRHNTYINPKKYILTAMAIILLFTLTLIPGGKNGKGRYADASEIKVKCFESIQVTEDDTLWSLAEEYGKEFDKPEVFIEEVKEINKISGDTIYKNAYLIVPVYK